MAGRSTSMSLSVSVKSLDASSPTSSKTLKRSPTEAIEEQNQALADALENATANNANSKEEN